MQKILKEISNNSITFFIEKNLDDFYTKSSKHPNFVSHIEDKIRWVIAKKADWPMAIFRADFESFNIKNEILNIRRLIREGKAPNGWTVGPLTKPDNLGVSLEKHGFSNVYQQAGMAVELKDLKDLKDHLIVEDKLQVERIENKEALKNWIDVACSTFGINIDSELIEFLLYKPETKFYIGKIKGKPVSSLMLYLSSGVAGLHAVSTLPEYRNKGFGLTISRTALIDAFDNGYKVGVLQASKMGERVYRKLGFKKYCEINSYEIDL